jgi:hypothetical protein
MLKNNKVLFIAIIVAVLCLLGVSGFIIYDKVFNKEEPPKPGINETPNIKEDNNDDPDDGYYLVYLKDKDYSDHLYWSDYNDLSVNDDDSDMNDEIREYLKSVFGDNYKGIVDYTSDSCNIFILDNNKKLYYVNKCNWSDEYETLKKGSFKQVLSNVKITNIGFYAGPMGGYFGLGGRLAPIIEIDNEVFFLNMNNGIISTTKLIDGINSENYYAIFTNQNTLYIGMDGKVHFEGFNNIVDAATNEELEVELILYQSYPDDAGFDYILITKDNNLYMIENDNVEIADNVEKILTMDTEISNQGTIKIQTDKNTHEYKYEKEY